MRRIFLVIATIATIFSLISCGSRDTEYYKAHPEEMKVKMEECKKMSTAEQMADRECSAVSQAYSGNFFQRTIPKPGDGKGQGFKKF